MAKTSRVQFNQFKRSADKWFKLFGLGDWEVAYTWEEMEMEGVMATAHFDLPNKMCFLSFTKEWDDTDIPMTIDEVKSSAFHEVCHILLGDLHLLAESRYVSNEIVFDERVHGIIKRLQNFVAGKKLL